MEFTFPLLLPLCIVGLVVAAIGVYAVFNIEHLIHYGETTGVSFGVTFAWLAGTALIAFFAWQLLQGTDWRQPIVVSSPASLPTFNFQQQPTPQP